MTDVEQSRSERIYRYLSRDSKKLSARFTVGLWFIAMIGHFFWIEPEVIGEYPFEARCVFAVFITILVVLAGLRFLAVAKFIQYLAWRNVVLDENHPSTPSKKNLAR